MAQPPVATAETRRAGALALIALSLGFGVVQLHVSVVNVAVRRIGADLHGGVSGLQWVVDAYTVPFASLLLGAGALGDRLGAKRVYLAGMAVFTMASVVCGLAPDLGALIAARAVQGAGAAVLVPSSLTLLNHAYPERAERQRAVGIWAAGATVALSAGPLVGGVLTTGLGWRSIFFINLPLGALGAGLTVRYLTDSDRSPGAPPDIIGQLLAVVTLTSLAYGTVEGGRRGFDDSLVLGCYALAVGAGASFIAVEGRRRAPMLPLSLFRSRPFSVTTALGLVVNVGFYGLIFVLSLYFQAVRGFSALTTGLAFAPTTVAIFVTNVLANRIVGVLGSRRTLQLSGLMMAINLAGLVAAGPHASFFVLVPPLVGLGAGLGALVPAMTAASLGSVDRARSGLASGTLNTARQTGSVIGVALYGSLAGRSVTNGLHSGLIIAVALALVTLGLASAITDPEAAGQRD